MALPIRPPASTQPGGVYATTPPVNTSGMSNDPMHDAAPGMSTADLTKTNVKAMQQFLKNRGYNIAVDGVRGPETNAAVLAFHKKVPAASFNSKGKATTTVAPIPKAGSGAGNAPLSAPVTAPKPSSDAPDTTALIDPTAYATGLANAQYNPQINALIAQLTQGKADESGHTKQIQDWFNQALGVQGDMADSNASAGKDALNAYNDSNANVLDLFGGPDSKGSTASEAQAFHDIGLGNLSADVNAQSQFDKNLKGITALQGSEAQTGQFNTDQQNLKTLASQLVSLKGAKGAQYAADYQTGLQNRTQQQAAEQQLKLAEDLAPSQVAAANANATVAKVNATAAAATSKTNLAIAKAKLKQANLATAAAKGGGGWNLAQPQQQGALQKAFETNVYGPRGGLSLQPDVAWNNLQQQLQMNGLANDPQAQAIAKGTFLQGLHSSHSLGNFGGWAWNGKTVVKTGNSYKFDKKSGKKVLVNKAGKPIPDYQPKS